MSKKKPKWFSSAMYNKAMQEIHDLKWQLSLKEAAWAAAEEVDRQKSERISELEREVRYLRAYGNKDCTAMADEAMANSELRQT